mmetsp:Transcript_27458/g.24335  ORF Transcript_27458/g.24335 Transcript_27458/m.24335 type:complete len:267 (-) Transcript_27458:51-851(-)
MFIPITLAGKIKMSGGFFDVDNDNANAFDSKKRDNFNDGEKKKTKMFIPITLSLLKTATLKEDDTFELDGEQVNDIIMIGRVHHREEQPTRTIYMINDNTGSIKITFYNREENMLPKYLQNFEYQENSYVKVFGTIRVFKDVKQVVGVHLSKIEDFDIITNHYLQVFVGSCVRSQGILGSQDLIEKEGETTTKGELSEEQKVTLVKETSTKLVEEAKSKGAENVSRDSIFACVKSKINFPEFEKIVKKLVEEMELFEGDGGAIGTF